MKKAQHVKYYLAAAVSLLTFAVYIAALQNSFVDWDDDLYVYANPYIRSFDLSFFKWAFLDFYASNWHPLTWMSHALDYAVWGLNPLGHHLTNNILHAVNTFLVVLLVAKLLEAAADHSPSTSHDSRFTLIAAVTTGLLFGLHPIHVESVAWVAERKDLLCALFYLLSIMMYVRYASHRTYRTYILSLGFFILALMSKPMAVSLPFVLLILDWYPFERFRSIKTLLSVFIEKIPFLALTLGSSVLTLLAQKAGGAMSMTEYVPFSTRILVGAGSLIAYIRNMGLPFNLLPFYPYPKGISIFSPSYLFPVVLVSGITIICLVIARRHKLWPAVWSYYVVTLLPVLGIIQVGGQSMADRYTYLPSLAPFLIVGLATVKLYEMTTGLKKLRSFAIIVVVAAIASMSYLTIQQTRIWRDGLVFWGYVIEKEPLKVPHAYNNRGFSLLENGRTDEAIEHFQTAISLAPAYAEAYNNLCIAYKQKGLYDAAMEQCLTAMRLRPEDPAIHNNLGIVYKYKGMYDQAIEQHRTALSLRPDYAEALFNIGNIYLATGRTDMAREMFEAGLRIQPDNEKARQVLNNIN